MKDALQLKSLPRRNAAIVAMRAAVADGRDRDALLAIPEIREAPHEKNVFGSLVRVHLTNADAAVRRAAWYALANAEAERLRDAIRGCLKRCTPQPDSHPPLPG